MASFSGRPVRYVFSMELTLRHTFRLRRLPVGHLQHRKDLIWLHDNDCMVLCVIARCRLLRLRASLLCASSHRRYAAHELNVLKLQHLLRP